ncbi:MAG: polyprenyl synthetase family protein, partial [Bradymonadaceae bacterium]
MKDQLLALRDRYAPPLLELMEETIESIPEDGSPLVEMGRHHLQTGGKRLRAMLPLAVGRRLGADPDALLPFGAACELLHNATLVHDDLQDGDRTRRGESTVWSTFGSERAINLGDAMLYWPLLLIDRLDCSAATRNTLYRTTTRQTLSVIDGQDREYE